MLHVHARFGQSQIHGLGLIAQQHIPADAVAWEFRPGFDLEFSHNDLQQLSEAARQQVLHYCTGDFCPERHVWTLSGDDARFTNHADDPNTINAEDGRITVAVRDIYPGDEITWNYHSFVTEKSVKLPENPTP